MDEKTRAKILSHIDEPTKTMFDASLVSVDRDIARSLQAFFVSDVFLTYWEHKALIDNLVAHDGKTAVDVRSRSQTVGGHDESREEVLSQVRKAFNTTEIVFLKRHFDITSSFTYKVHLGSKDGAHIGYGVQRGSTFYFYNLQEELILKVLSGALLGKTSAAEGGSAMEEEEVAAPAAQDVDDDVAAAGCCGGGGSRGGGGGGGANRGRSRAATAEAVMTNFYVRDSAGTVHGPIKQTSLQLLFRYHVLPLAAAVSPDNKAWKTVADYPEVFSPSRRIETIDPTEVPTF